MPPVRKDGSGNQSIKEFFKKFTIPKERIPTNDVIEEEIVVALPKLSPYEKRRNRKPSRSPRGRNDGSRDAQSSQSSSAISSLSPSPTRQSTPRATPNMEAPVLQPDCVTSSPSTHIDSSQRRVMTVVEIPSSKPLSPDIKPEKAPPRPVTMSFSSVSTLSSVPVSTQSSSRRVVKNGIQAITNSDSGSAESSDEEELADISTFIPQKRTKLTPSPSLELDTDHAIEIVSTVKRSTRQTARSSEGSKKSSSVSKPRREASPPPTKPVYKHSLMNLVKQREKEQKAERRMKAMEQEFAALERKREEDWIKEREAMSGLKAVMADDSDEGERMMLAMQRTGALEGEEEFYYFAGTREDIGDKSFPANTVVNDERAWVRKLKDEKWRTHACLSGFVAELASRDGMPYIIQEWMAQQLIHEEREDLCESYVGILQVCQEDILVEPLTEHKDVFECMPMKARLLERFYSLQDTSINQPTTEAPARLRYVLRVVERLGAARGDYVIGYVLRHLMFANIDANVAKDSPLKAAVEQSIEHLLLQVTGTRLEDTYDQIHRHLTSSTCSTRQKYRAVASLPACSERSHALRRKLALHLIIAERVCVPLRNPQHAEAILSRLEEAPEFAITESTDYHLLNPLIQILDIAIDNGFDARSSNPEPIKGSATILPPLATEKAFNAQIDSFISRLSLMISRIRDAGTTHIHRTQAKCAMERLVKRLEYGVRTKPRPRKGIFSNGSVMEDGQREFLKGFLKVVDKKGEVEEVDGKGALLAAEAE